MNVPAAFRCHACGGEVPPIPAAALRFMAGSDCTPVTGEVHVGVCSSCGLTQKDTSQAWQSLCDRIYGDYQIYHQAAGHEQKARTRGQGALAPRSELIARFLAQAADLPKRGSLLDIGCGNGAFLQAVTKILPDWRVTGSDLNESFRESIVAISPRAAFQNPEQLERGAARFHIVSFIHCIEHIPAPVAYLAEARRHIEAGGVLLIEVPDAELNPFDLVVADHASHFSKRTLSNVVAAAGYELIACGNLVVGKEITVLARPLHDMRAAALEPYSGDSPDLARRNLAWLEETINCARALASANKPFGIFGTSIAGVWISTALKNQIDFFVDEDEMRVGREYFGTPILAPSSVPAGATVFVCLEPELAQSIVARHGKSSRRYVAPSPLS